MRFVGVWRLAAAVMMVALAFEFAGRSTPGATASAAQGRTPTAGYSWDQATPPAGDSTGSAAGNMGGMDMGTPIAGMAMEMEFDQLYIDMMILHHQSIVALAQAALPRLEDERLQTIAQAIIDAQTAEVEELRGYREQFYGSPDTMPMDAAHMEAMSEVMPGMGSMEEMAVQMSADAQVAAFCVAEHADVAFIEMVIPHHEMAIAASEAAVEQATHEEIQSFAERVIEDQEREIDELTVILVDISGAHHSRSPGRTTS